MNAHALVVGGGLAGGALAFRLARAGRDVVLLERESGPVDKVCGEFLSHEAMTYLASLGVDLVALGAVPIEAVRLCTKGRTTTVPLPFAATSLSRRVLDEALLERAATAGVDVRRGARVREIVSSPRRTDFEARMENGDRVSAATAFLATGKHDLRDHRRPSGLQDDLVGFKLYYRLAPNQARALDAHVELVPFRGGYAGLQPIEGGRANLCLLVRKRRLHEVGNRWERLLGSIREESPELDGRLRGAEACWTRPLALSNIPYGHVRSTASEDGLWRVGDQAAVIPSFSGDGMSIALHSADLCASIYLAGGTVESYQRRLAAHVRRQVLLGTVLSHALVRNLGQTALGLAARLWPSLVSAVAFHTRVPETALPWPARANAHENAIHG